MKYILHISFDTKQAEYLGRYMTDEMWQKVNIFSSSDETFLILPDGNKIYDVKDIVQKLKPEVSFLGKIRNARNATHRVYKQIRDGGNIRVENDVIEKRREACNNCPLQIERWMMKICSNCGCNIKAKTSLITESCPLDKW